LKQDCLATRMKAFEWVFTLQSIKSRIETSRSSIPPSNLSWFLLYSPLNQGLKPA